MMEIPLDEVVYFDVITSTPSTGAAVDADSTPTFAVYEEATDTDIGVGGNLTKRTSLTGNYRGSFTASAANGFEVGKWYSVIASATVGAVAGKCRALGFRCAAAENTAGFRTVDTAKWNNLATVALPLIPTTAGRTLDVSAGGEAGVDWANVGSQSTSVNLSATTTNLVNTVTTYTGNTVQTGDTYALANGVNGFVATKADTAAILVDTNELQTDWVDGGRLDLILDARASQASVNTIDDFIDSEITTILSDLGTIYTAVIAVDNFVDTEIGTIITDIAAVKSDTAAILIDTAEIGTAGAGLTNINLPNQTMDIIGNITGNLSGSVGSVTGAVGSVTGAVGSVTGNVGGNVTGSVGSVVGAVGSVTGNVGGNVVGSVASVTAAVTVGTINSTASNLKKNTALSAFEFVMTDSTNHALVTGITVTATRSLDGGAFAACANSASEVGSGVYKIDLATTDMNANTVTLKFAGTGADDTIVTLITQP